MMWFLEELMWMVLRFALFLCVLTAVSTLFFASIFSRRK